MKIVAVTQKGINKRENEDRVIIGKNIISEGIFQTELLNGIVAIADGVGGNKAGATAAHFVAKCLTDLNDDISLEKLKKINDELLRHSLSTPQYEYMATTLAGISFGECETQLFSIGNTRVYLLQGGKYLKQLTEDDTIVQYLVSTGQITLEESETFERKNEIIACFGGGYANLFSKMRCNTISNIITPFLMTSDGIHDYISIDQIEEILVKQGITVNACELIISEARNNGSEDDASIIVGQI